MVTIGDFIRRLIQLALDNGLKLPVDERQPELPWVTERERKEFAQALTNEEPKTLDCSVVERCLKAWNVRVRMNEITGRMDIDGLPDRYTYENALNTLPVLVKDWLRDFGFKASTGIICEYIMAIADKDHYNPVIDMVCQTWDKQDRFPELHRILGIEHGGFHSQLLLKWLAQCVELAFNSDRQPRGADGMLVLQGPQGCGKTRFFSVICSPKYGFFREGLSVDVDRVDSRIQATGCWIAELGELDSTLRREQAGLKAFITAASDVYRRPYAKADITRPRRTSFCATVNQENFLRDDTGNRRYWVIPVAHIDVSALNELKPEWVVQLWRQVFQELFVLNNYRLDADESAQLAQQNRHFMRPLPGEQEVRDLLKWDMLENTWDWFKPSEIKARLHGYGGASANQIGKVLRKLCEEDERVRMKRINGTSKYRLPLKRFD